MERYKVDSKLNKHYADEAQRIAYELSESGMCGTLIDYLQDEIYTLILDVVQREALEAWNSGFRAGLREKSE